jgi:LAO/AO transport system kinase
MKGLTAAVSEREWDILVDEITRRERDPYSVASELQTRLGLSATQEEVP